MFDVLMYPGDSGHESEEQAIMVLGCVMSLIRVARPTEVRQVSKHSR